MIHQPGEVGGQQGALLQVTQCRLRLEGPKRALMSRASAERVLIRAWMLAASATNL